MTTGATQAVADTVRAEMARRRYTQRFLAEKLDMSQSALNRRMTGVQPWDVEELTALAALFEMDVRDLLPAAATP
jgi:transcriptional regulator with XRE-family HTH domain